MFRPVHLAVALSMVVALLPAAGATAAAADWSIPQGRFFTETGGPAGNLGYAVTNRDGVRFWDAFQALGGVPSVGYPVSGRFIYDGFVTQVMQKAVFQWRPDTGAVSFVNVFDDLTRAGRDDWLYAARSTPRPLPPGFDAGKDWAAVVRDRTALLDARPAIKARYLAVADPILRYGLPTSRIEDMGTHYAVRLQRAVIQEWKVDVPWARAGETTVANGGDIMKEAGLVPAGAVEPESASAPGVGATVPGAAGGSTDARVTADSAAVVRTPGGLEVASLFRNATVEVLGAAVDGPGGAWLPVRLWNALTGWLPRAAVAMDGFPAQDRAPGTPYRRPIPPAPAPPIPLALDAPAIVAVVTPLLDQPDGQLAGWATPEQPLRLVGYAKGASGLWFQVRGGDAIGWVPSRAVALGGRDPLAPLPNGVPISALVAGKGMWATVDLLDRASADAVVQTARANGLSHIYVQVARSNLGFYGQRALDQLLPIAHANGVAVVGWVYPFLRDVVADVYMTNDAVRYTTPDGHRVDALAADLEENVDADDVGAYGQIVRALEGDNLLMIAATYPPEMPQGRTYPYATVARTWNVIAPMDYYRSAQASTPEAAYGYVARSIQIVRERAGRPVVVQPIGQAYGKGWPNETGPTNPSAEETRAMLAAARDNGAVGISFFEWAHATAAQWREIGAFQW